MTCDVRHNFCVPKAQHKGVNSFLKKPPYFHVPVFSREIYINLHAKSSMKIEEISRENADAKNLNATLEIMSHHCNQDSHLML